MSLADELGLDPRTLDGQPGGRGYQMRMASMRKDAAARAQRGEDPLADEPLIAVNQAAGPAAALAGMIPGGFIPPTPTTGEQINIPHVASLTPHTSVGGDLRVAVYVARGDMLSVAVESAPEWDTVKQWKLDEATVVALLPILRALGVKLKDTTGDLDELELKYAVGQGHQSSDSWADTARGATAHAPQDQQARGRAKAPSRRRAAS